MQQLTVGELIKTLQDALKRGELEWDSEVLDMHLHPASMYMTRNREEDGLRIPGHVVIS